MLRFASLSALTLVGLSTMAFAQEFHMPKASPTVTISQEFSTSTIVLKYSRPSLRGRAILGEQVPYGKVWRTGANQATEITFGEDVYIAGSLLKAGDYELYTIPNPKEWTFIFNKNKNNWGARGYSDDDNVLRVTVPAQSNGTHRETLDLSFQDMQDDSACNLVLAWDQVRVAVPIRADNNQRILDHLAKALQGENPPYYEAAVYYLNTNQKMEEALKYVTISIEKNPEAYYMMWRKARILQKLGRHEEAVAEAKKAADVAKDYPAFADEYEGHYQQMLRMK